ncbi:MAG TPA: helix-turn-helix domain-containing protein, partial [Chthoniobacterales bacterium]
LSEITLSPRQVAELTPCDKRTVLNHIKRGILPCERRSTHTYRLPVSAVKVLRDVIANRGRNLSQHRA